MKLNKKDDSKEVFNNEKAIGKLLSSDSDIDLVRLSIEPDGVIPPHEMELNVTFYIISGKGDITFNGNTTSASAGDSISIEPTGLRSWKNNGNEILELLVIKKKN